MNLNTLRFLFSPLWCGLVLRLIPIFVGVKTGYTRKQSHHNFKPYSQPLICVVLMQICLIANSTLGEDYYIRGSVAFDQLDDTIFTDSYCPSGTPAALYGCGTGSDDYPYSSKGSFDRFTSIEIGLGLSTRSDMRFEFLVEYQPRSDFTGNTNFLNPEIQQSVVAEVSTLSSSLIGYLDFPKLSWSATKRVVPYVGAGFGVTRNRIETTTMTFPVTTTTVPGGRETRLTWIASVGASMELSARTKLDLGMRYTDRSKVRTGLGEGAVNWRNGVRGPLVLDLARTEAKLRGYSLRLSFRYSPTTD